MRGIVEHFAGRLAAAGRLVLVTHNRPDGDALGTTGALSHALREAGRDAVCLVTEPLPEKYAFLYDGVPYAVATGVEAAGAVTGADLVLICDTGTWSQLAGLREAIERFAGEKLVLDHHQTQEDWADLHLVDTTAGAAAEVAARVIDALGVAFTKPIATCLYVALATDTGHFSYANTSPATLRLAARCVEAGADVDDVGNRLYRSERAQAVLLTARALASLRLLEGGRLAVMTLSRADYDAAGATPDDGEGLINEPMKIATVAASLLVGEFDAGTIKISLRSKGGVDCAKLLQAWGGGGHARAAGARVTGTLHDVAERVIRDVADALAAR